MHHFSALKRVFRHPSSESTAMVGAARPLQQQRGDSTCSMAEWIQPIAPKPLPEPIKAAPPPVSAWSTTDDDDDREHDPRQEPRSHDSCKLVDRPPAGTGPGQPLLLPAPQIELPSIPQMPCPLTLSAFKLVKTVGTGSFGRVYMAKMIADGSPVAIKRLTKVCVVKQKQVAHVLSEKEILAQISHPFLVSFFGTFQDPDFLYIIMEYVEGGEFFSHLRKNKRLPDTSVKFYAAHITCIFEYLHSLSIVYRDLKPENLLITRKGYLKLADFGFAKILRGRTYTLCGTPEYIAPEVLRNKGHGKGVDWWTLGILIYEMIVGYPPFYDNEALGIYQRILEGKVVFPRFFPKDARSLVKRLLIHDTAHRMGHVRHGISDVRGHRWFSDLDFTALLAQRLTPPYIPRVKAADDTSNFGDYDENGKITTMSEREQADIKTGLLINDPFSSW